MALEIIWSEDAGYEYEEIIDWLKITINKNYADKIFTKINQTIEAVAENPKIGKEVQLLKDIGIREYRQITETYWVIFYRIESNAIKIVSIIDGRRNLEEILYKKVIDGKIT